MAQFDKAELEKLSKAEVVEEAERLKIDIKGTKADIIGRLMAFDERDTNDDEDELDDDDLIDAAPAAADDDELDDEAPTDEADDEEDDTPEPIDDKANEERARQAVAKEEAARDIKAVAARESVDDDEVDDEDDDLVLDEEEVDTPAEPVKKTRAKRTSTPKAVKAADEAVDQEARDTVAAKQIALMLDVPAKTLRQFFRSDSSTTEPVGAGGRYEFTQAQVETIKKEFATWRSEHAARGQRRTEGAKGKGSKPKPEVVEVEDAKELDIDELDDTVDESELELDDEED